MYPASGAPKSKRGSPAPTEVTRLASLGLTAGTPVRFRRITKTRWYTGRLERLERDGSIGIRDSQGALRSIPVADVVIPATGPRGGQSWQPLIDFLLVGEQIALFEDDSAPSTKPVHGGRSLPTRDLQASKLVHNPDQTELAEVENPDLLPMGLESAEIVDLDGQPLDPGHCMGQQTFEF